MILALNVPCFAKPVIELLGRSSVSLLPSLQQESGLYIYSGYDISVKSVRLLNRTRVAQLPFHDANFQVALSVKETGAEFRVSLSCELRHSPLFSELLHGGIRVSDTQRISRSILRLGLFRRICPPGVSRRPVVE